MHQVIMHRTSQAVFIGHHTVESKMQCLDEAHIGVTTMDDTEGRPIIPNPCGGSNKRRRRKACEPADRGSDSDDEFIPTRKLQKASSHRHKQNPSHYANLKDASPNGEQGSTRRFHM